MQKNTFLFSLFLITTISFSQSHNCAANLIVENNGNIRSTPPDGTYYSMILTNTGSIADTYSLFAKNINASCNNTDGSSSTGNIIINIGFIDSDKNPITQIHVNAGQSVNFFAHVTVPPGTSVAKWSCNQITAASTNCTNSSTDTVLHTYVINPFND